VTGQAAWFDLRVRIVKCAVAECGVSEPQFEPLQPPPHIAAACERLAFGAEFRRGRARR
jgi:hypothetical protein